MSWLYQPLPAGVAGGPTNTDGPVDQATLGAISGQTVTLDTSLALTPQTLGSVTGQDTTYTVTLAVSPQTLGEIAGQDIAGLVAKYYDTAVLGEITGQATTWTITVNLEPQTLGEITGVDVEGGEPTTDTTVVHAGGGPARRRRYTVQIDDREFEVESAEHAEALLERAREMARKAAEAQAEKVVAKALPRARVVGKVESIKLEVPRVSGVEGAAQAQRQIEAIYAQVAAEAELRLLLQIQAERDEEDSILLLI